MNEKNTNKPVKNRAQTEQKLINAVGVILVEKGYNGLGVNAIAKEAGVDKKLIYRYFGNVSVLIETYMLQKDYWNTIFKTVIPSREAIADKNFPISDFLTATLQSQLDFFYKEAEMQNIILWGLSEKNELLQAMTISREELGDRILNYTDTLFDNDELNFRAVMALLVAGIYHLVLHAKGNGVSFCGIDINSKDGRASIKQAIAQITALAYSKRKKTRTKKKAK